MRRSKSRRRHIVVQDVEYLWRAQGDDGFIRIGIRPASNLGSFLRGNLGYHETWIDEGDGLRSSAKDQIIVTNRIIRRIIEYAISEHHYDPKVKGKELNLKGLDGVIRWDDAIRPE